MLKDFLLDLTSSNIRIKQKGQPLRKIVLIRASSDILHEPFHQEFDEASDENSVSGTSRAFLGRDGSN